MKWSLVLLAGCLTKPPPPADIVEPPPIERRFAAGAKHVCSIDDGSSLSCWGDNSHGQLGVDTVPFSGTPIDLGAGWTAIAAGTAHSCGVRNDQVLCWGRCLSGPGCADISVPTVVPSLAGAVEVFAGGDATCIVDADGALSCLGAVDATQPSFAVATPLSPAGFATGWAEVRLAVDHACALSGSGDAYCWGHDESFQLGSTDGADHGVTDAVLQEARKFEELAVGAAGTCGITITGNLDCWGGGIVTGAMPSDFAEIDADTAWTRVAVGDRHVCGIDNGGVRCYGTDDRGALGDAFAARPQLATATVLDDAVSVVAGNGMTCAKHTAGDAWCWGTNQVGEIGNGEVATQYTPFAVDLVIARLVAVGGGHACATTANGVSCWGDNRLLQAVPTDAADAFLPTPQSALSTIAAGRIALGSAHSCMVDTNGIIQCWGDNRLDQAPPKPFKASSPRRYDSIVVGGDASCAIDDSPPPASSVSCWGNVPQVGAIELTPNFGSYGLLALGSGFVVGRNSLPEIQGWGAHAQLCSILSDIGPTLPANMFDGAGTWQLAAAQLGSGHICAIRTDMTTELLCWGANDFGQVAGPSSSDCVATPTAVPAPTGDSWSMSVDGPQVAVAGNRSCALGTTGTLYCWGDNRDHVLGDMLPAGVIAAPQQAVEGTWASVAVGPADICAISVNNQQVSCWGLNQFGEVGNGKRFHEQPVPVVAPRSP